MLAFLMACLATGAVGQESSRGPSNGNGKAAPTYRVDPFWPKPLPNRWSMQQVTGIHVDHMDHIWFLNRGAAAEGDEIGGGGTPSRIDCCVRGPEVIELDQQGNVVNAGTNELILPNYKQTWANIRKLASAPASVKHLSFKSQEYKMG